mgnify:CR=1 FL=1
MERANPFAELDELEIKPKKRNPDVVEQISQIADDHGFPSRQAVKPIFVFAQKMRIACTGSQTNTKYSWVKSYAWPWTPSKSRKGRAQSLGVRHEQRY